MTVILQVAFLPLPSLAVAVMVTVPFLMPLTIPVWVTAAIFLLLVVHLTDLLLAEAGAIVTLRVVVLPLIRVSFVLLIVSLVTGCLTVILQVAFFPLPSLAVAVMVTVPLAMPLTTPLAVTVAIFLLLVFQVTVLL